MHAHSSSADGYEELASTLTPATVERYLAANGWTLEKQEPEVRQIWTLPGDDAPRGRIMLPLATDYVDFARRFQDTLRSIAFINGWDTAQLLDHIAPAVQD